MIATGAPPRRRYDWKRFWCPRNGTLHLTDGGYLADPEGAYGRYLGSDLRPFEKISDLPCLACWASQGSARRQPFAPSGRRSGSAATRPCG